MVRNFWEKINEAVNYCVDQLLFIICHLITMKKERSAFVCIHVCICNVNKVIFQFCYTGSLQSTLLLLILLNFFLGVSLKWFSITLILSTEGIEWEFLLVLHNARESTQRSLKFFCNIIFFSFSSTFSINFFFSAIVKHLNFLGLMTNREF